MRMRLSDVAAAVDGVLFGYGEIEVSGANPPQDASADEVTLLDSPRRFAVLEDSAAAAVITAESIPALRLPQIVVACPHQAFATLVAIFRPPIEQVALPAGIDPTATVDPSANVHPSAVIGANVKIGKRTQIFPGVVVLPNSVIGDDCILHSNATLYEYTQLGNRVVLHAGAVLGAHGFGYRQENGKHVPTSQLGYVRVDDEVEIGACVTIDRGTYGATRIGCGTKIDNQVMIGHNCHIGKHNLICSQVGIAGSCRTGDYVVLAGQVGLKDHITLGDHTVVGAQAGVMEDCEQGEIYLGSPATTQREQMQIMAVQRRLPEMRRELKQLKRSIGQLQQAVSNNETSKNKRVA